MKKLISTGVLLSFLFFIPACKSSSTTPTPPAVTVSSITVTSASTMLKVGQTETFTATCNMSNGTQQAATGTWSSSDTNIATVSNVGLVTIVGAGNVNIIMTQSGKTGSKGIRGVPDYQGTWTGTYHINSCAQTFDWATLDFCSILNGLNLETSFVMTQLGDIVSGTFYLGTNVGTITSGQIAANGQLTLTGLSVNGTASIDVIYTLQSSTPGQITGTLFQLWKDSTLLGDMQLSCTNISVSKINPTPNEAFINKRPLHEPATIQEMIQALRIR